MPLRGPSTGRTSRARHLTRAALPLGGLLLATACSGSSAPHYKAVAPPKVVLADLTQGSSTPVTIGVVLSTVSTPGQGADDVGLAAGARVAQYRVAGAGGRSLVLDVVDDHGTSAGAVAAVGKLVRDHVDGVVAATQGSHLAAALKAAAAAQTAVLLPYQGTPLAGATTSWLTGPTDQQVSARLSQVLSVRGIRRTYVLRGDGASSSLAGLHSAARSAPVAAGAGLPDAVRGGTQALARHQVDGVAVVASAATEAASVGQLQGADPDLPVVLGPSALSPVFGQTLTDLSAQGGATTAGVYVTAGEASTDNATTSGVSGFFGALRLAAADPAVLGLSGRATFASAGAATADTRSHDAVLTLLRAARAAQSVGAPGPAGVLAALGTLTVTSSDGLAGPSLDFHSHQALAADDVVALQATPQDPGLRAVSGDATPALSWFALPDGKA